MAKKPGFDLTVLNRILRRNPGLSWKEITELYNQENRTRLTVSGLRGMANRKGVTKEENRAPLRSGAQRKRPAQKKVPEELGPKPADVPDGPERSVYTDERKDSLEIRVIGPEIECEEDAIREAKIDTKKWMAVRQVKNAWPTTMMGLDGIPIQVINRQFKIWFEPRKMDSLELIRDVFRECIEPVRFAIRRKPRKMTGNLCYVGLHDVHWAKYAWAAETGTDFDIDLARVAYLGAIEETVEKAALFGVDRFVIPAGQDFFHIDNPGNTTVNGTPQDVDTRWQKMTKTGLKAVIQATEMLRQVAPVDWIYVPGNHDTTLSYMLALALECKYDGAKDVTVDTGPAFRKYREHGVCLIGMTHGSEEKHTDLPGNMANENCRNGAWCRTTDHVFFLGHKHRKKVMKYMGADTVDGVSLIELPSLTATDAWHARKGYVGAPRATECHFLNDVDGHVGHFSMKVRIPASAA